MLTFDQFDVLSDPIVDLYDRYVESVILDLVKRFVRLGKITATSARQMQRLIESGGAYEHALSELAKATQLSEKQLAKMFRKAGVRSVKFDDVLYRAAGLDPLPLNLSPSMIDVLRAGLTKTRGLMKNLTMTTAIDARNALVSAIDLAYMQVSSGAMTYDEAIRQGVKALASQGLSMVEYANGRKTHLDVAVRRTVLTGVSQTVGQLSLERAIEMGTDLVETSAHQGARNEGVGPMNHESWQGRVFSLSGSGSPIRTGLVPTSQLIGLSRQGGDRTQAQIESLRSYIEQTRQVPHTILVSYEKGKYDIVDGNHSIRLAQELGITELPVRVITPMGDPVDESSLPTYPNFFEVTGYGTGEGLHGWNCRHSFFPFFEGLSSKNYSEADLQSYANKTVTYRGKQMSFYEASQIQRSIERDIRQAKREENALNAVNLDSTKEHLRVRRLQKKMRDFIRETKIDRQYIREQV